MQDPIAAGRRSALRAVVVQATVAAVVALAYLAEGPAHALAAGWGGAVMVAAHALSARVALGGIVPAGAAFGRLMLATMVKWLVALSGFAIGLEAWLLPPLPMFVGLAAGLLAYLLALARVGSKLGNGKERER